MNFSLRPVFIGWITLLAQLPLQLFLTVWTTGFFGIIAVLISSLLTGFEEDPDFTAGPFLLIGALAFFGIPLVIYFGKKLNYARTEYRFFDDHLEFEEGFLTIRKKEIRYRDVEEITLRKGAALNAVQIAECLINRKLLKTAA